eukprot:CAMPEP_0201539822 /NCGR_PEP_ID=MMETSP0161_2-20130828/70615_1 /ASSEMBLY_ACC=CAM_ASM_000251 /TAXON_ID=180227 /ORGANISM="Neoparamoeba aestuarina, Strain SoJaBio B1-5/56/2" /LENGTH=140 /DNA_ID=CAMNT_0047947245 /DNA_START=82 /DNA_END=501 /DNA_ORIENTATION=-
MTKEPSQSSEKEQQPSEDPRVTRAKQMMENAAEKWEDALAQGEAKFKEAREKVKEATERVKQAASDAREVMVEYEERLVSLEKFQSEVVEPVKSFVLFHSEHIPEYLKSPFVASSYRANYSFEATFVSIVRWHNESFNIW